jgi:WD40 repeat protein
LSNGDLATTSGDAISIWNVKTGELKVNIVLERGMSWPRHLIELNSNSLAGCCDNKISIVNLTTQSLARVLNVPEQLGFIDKLVLLNDGNIASLHWHQKSFEVNIIDPVKREFIESFKNNCADHMHVVHLFPDGIQAIVLVQDCVQTWNVRTSQVIRTIDEELPLEMNDINMLFLSQDTFAISYSIYYEVERFINIVNLRTGQVSEPMFCHTGSISDMALLPNGHLLSCSSDNTIECWSVESGEFLKKIYTPSGYAWDMAYFKNSNYLATLTV